MSERHMDTREESLMKLDALAHRVKAAREALPSNSPLHATYFRLAALIGKTEAAIAAQPPRAPEEITERK